MKHPLQCNSSYCCTLLNLQSLLDSEAKRIKCFTVLCIADLHSFFSAVSWIFLKNSSTTTHALLDLLYIYGLKKKKIEEQAEKHLAINQSNSNIYFFLFN